MNVIHKVVPGEARWIGRQEIGLVPGALKPCAYVARAYNYLREHGVTPVWARKVDDRWRFSFSYIEADARRNSLSMSVHEAAALIGASRRTVQTWVDAGEIRLLDSDCHAKGGERRILKEPFLKNIEIFRRRLETPAVVARKINKGLFIPSEVVDRINNEDKCRRARARMRDRERLRKWRQSGAIFKAGPKNETARVETRKAVLVKTAALDLEKRLDVAMRARQSAASAEEQRTIAVYSRTEEAKHRVDLIKRKAAAALEDKLHKAAGERRISAGESQLVTQAEQIGRQVLNKMHDENFGRTKAMILFSQLAQRLGVPVKIRIRISRRIFGEGGGK